MTRSFTRLAWTAATFTYLLIILGAIVRITGSGLGCGEHWPLCNGKLLPPLDLPTMIEYGHRLAAAAVSGLVTALAAYTWWLRKGAGSPKGVPDGPGERYTPDKTAYVALALLVVQVLLGAVTVKLRLPPWTIILHLGTAMLLLATLIVAARLTPGAILTPGASPGIPRTPRSRAGSVALGLGFVTVLFGALTANLGAASACLGFPLCNGQVVPAGNYLQHIHWGHRLLAYTLFGYLWWWALRTRTRGAWWVVGLVTLQVAVAAAMVLLRLPAPLQATHVAVGAAVWAGLVLALL
ncbi:MAG TPA: COX15/CtaA family protein [Gemmatimonadales bacterium]|nr:COX15/CtaA family protein [Gemmatimonadales bacterium]